MKIPKNENSKILDIGCGTGVPTIWIAENFPWTVIAIDTDKDSLYYLQKKIKNKHLQNKIKTLNKSFFNYNSEDEFFEIILAEGFLNVVGFETGFKRVIKLLKKRGYFIIHDEYKDHQKKCEFIHKNNCKIIDSLYLNEGIWWNDYYQKLEFEINNIKDIQLKSLFSSDIKEIEYYKSDPSLFRSIYYIVLKL
ncbi:MAG: class I SAM-dependent methyltransferase [Ignavibacteriales bacterium]|nr:class I SAM-dependent methyltransferase [Ignavibacteriales bacterium]